MAIYRSAARLSVPIIAATFVLVSSLARGQASAQQTGTPAETQTAAGLEEVIVTARYRQESLQTTPVAITAVTAEDIEARGFTSAADIAFTTPNAVARPAQQAFGNTLTYFIRGIGQSDFNFAFEPGVGIYVDDVYYPTTMASQFDLLDVQDVETLRGPQGTLFGRGAIGGAVRYNSKQPKGDNSGYLESTVGDFHRVDVRGGFDVSIIPDKLFVRVSGVERKQDGFQKVVDFACANPAEAGTLPTRVRNRLSGCQTGTLGGVDIAGARAQFHLVATDRMDFDVALDYQRDNSEARADTLMGIGPLVGGFASWDQAMFNGTIPGAGGTTVRPNPNFFGYGVHYDNRFVPSNPYVSYDTFSDPYSGLQYTPRTSLSQKGVSGTWVWRLTDDVSMKYITAWREWNGYFATDQDGSPLGLSVVDGIQQFTYRTNELRFEGTLLKRLDWTVGGFYYDGNSASAQSVELPQVGPLPLYLANPQQYALLVNGLDHGHFENMSGYMHGIFHVTDALRLTAGARISNDKKSDLNDNTIVVQSVSSSKTRFDWLLGGDYQILPTMMAYASAATGYRPPAFNPRPFQASQFKPVSGESLTEYEIGLKSDLFDHRARVNLALFYGDYKQHIVGASGLECVTNPDGTCVGGPNAPAVVPLTAYVNAPAKLSGFEVDAQFRPVHGLLLTASTGYLHTSASATTFQGVPYTGLTPTGEFGGVPQWTASATAQYTLELPDGSTLAPRWDAYMNTRICEFAPNAVSGYTAQTSCAGGFVLHNIRLEYANKDRLWVAAAGINNVTNKFYWQDIFDLTAFGEPTIEGQPNAPRMWYLTVRRNF
jgi:iron complex outermembrane recepter protein